MVNVGKYTIHGSYGYVSFSKEDRNILSWTERQDMEKLRLKLEEAKGFSLAGKNIGCLGKFQETAGIKNRNLGPKARVGFQHFIFDMDILIFLPIYDLIYYWYVKNVAFFDIFEFIGLYCDFNCKILKPLRCRSRVSLGVGWFGLPGVGKQIRGDSPAAWCDMRWQESESYTLHKDLLTPGICKAL